MALLLIDTTEKLFPPKWRRLVADKVSISHFRADIWLPKASARAARITPA